MELIALLLALVLWLGRPCVSTTRYMGWHHRLQTWWAASLLRSLLWSYAVQVRVEGAESGAEGLYLMLPRHTSMGDTLLAMRFIPQPYDIRLRYVLKAALRWEPVIDIFGHRIPNVFVERGSDHSAEQRRRVTTLAQDLGRRDGVVMFPEGTRYSARGRDQLIARLEASGDSARAGFGRSLVHVLPPRYGGVTALLQAHPGLDVVFCAHRGFEEVTRLPDLMSGALVGRTIDVAFWRVRTSGLDTTPAAIAEWLDQQWRDIDRWVAGHVS